MSKDELKQHLDDIEGDITYLEKTHDEVSHYDLLRVMRSITEALRAMHHDK